MPLITIMQFSDLHKTATAFDSDKALVSSIVSDIARHHKEEIPISEPTILVVCGDIIRGSGLPMDFELSILEIEQQYKEADDLLNQLCNELGYPLLQEKVLRLSKRYSDRRENYMKLDRKMLK